MRRLIFTGPFRYRCVSICNFVLVKQVLRPMRRLNFVLRPMRRLIFTGPLDEVFDVGEKWPDEEER